MNHAATRTLGATLALVTATAAIGGPAWAPTMPSVAVRHTAVAQGASQRSWDIVPGSKVPTPVMATAVRGRMPGFLETDVVYLLAFVNFGETQSREALAALERAQTEHGRKLVVVAITDQGPDDTRAFIESAEWAPRTAFVVAADPRRSAFRTFFGPQRVPQLPHAFIMRNGVVQWTGNPAACEEPVGAIVRGTWDMEAAKRAMEQRALWAGMLQEVERLAEARKFDEALEALDGLCASAIGDQNGQCLGARFSVLLRAGRVHDALAVGEQILAAPMNPKQPAGLAWTLISYAPDDTAARAFALRAAQASDTALRNRDPMVAAILARVQFVNGQRSQAVETAQRALSIADTPDLRAAIRDDLKRYESAPAVGATAPAGTPATPGAAAPSGTPVAPPPPAAPPAQR